MACNDRKPVKVVIIGTQFIETSPLRFKSVVQSLTGKDSCVSWVEESSYDGRKRRREADESSEGRGYGDAKFSKWRSFKELDRLLTLELPSDEELRRVWGTAIDN